MTTRTPVIVRRENALRRRVALLRRRGRRIVFVPTMGALHAGHRKLIHAATGPNHVVVVSIFVNPRQFGPQEDYAAYPRPLSADLQVCREAGADLVYVPDVDDLYPGGFATTIHVEGLDRHLCGRFRPGHFDGVTTIVLKLLHVVQPDRMLLGQKDAQQAVICGRMIEDLDLPVQLKIVPTVREADGLAYSSRNRYLSTEERGQAPELYAALKMVGRLARDGEKRAGPLLKAFRNRLRAAPLFRLQYVEIVDAGSLVPVDQIRGRLILAAAAFLGRARLIDNIRLNGNRTLPKPRQRPGGMN